MKREIQLSQAAIAVFDLKIKHLDLFLSLSSVEENGKYPEDPDADEALPLEDNLWKFLSATSVVNKVQQSPQWWQKWLETEALPDDENRFNEFIAEIANEFNDFAIPYSAEATPFGGGKFGYFLGENFTRKTFLSNGEMVTFKGIRHKDREKLNQIQKNPNLTEAQRIAKIGTRLITEMNGKAPEEEYFKVAQFLELPITDAVVIGEMLKDFFGRKS